MKTQVARRKLGATDEVVSEVSLGAMNLRMIPDVADAYKLVHHVLDQGINLIDTARVYNGENPAGLLVESEKIVGEVIESRTDLDEPIVIVTKGHGYTLDALKQDLFESRERLRITGQGPLYIGKNEVRLVYFFHGINAERWQQMQSSGVLEKIQQYQAEGFITYAGFSAHYGDGEAICAAADTGIFQVAELTYNVFNRSLGEDGEIDLLKYLYERGVGIVNMKAFNGNGMPPLYPLLREFVSLDYGDMLDFCLSNPYITTVDAGARTIEEFDADIAVSTQPRMNQQTRKLAAQEADKVSGHMNDLCRECLHCLEKFACPQGLDFPKILALYSRHKLANALERPDPRWAEAYRQIAKQADQCVACGGCVPWCEYKLNIPEMMKNAHEALK